MNKIIKIIFTTSFLLTSIFFIGFFALAENEYDFKIISITTSPAEPILNQLCDITVTIKSVNPGTITDNSGVDDYWYNFNNFEISEVTLPEISAQNPIEQDEAFTYVLTGIFNKIQDRTVLDFYVNKNQTWPETRLTNNDLRITVEVISAYDLEVASIEILSTNPAPGQDIKINVGIKNNGKVDLITGRGLSSYLINFDNFDLKKATIPEITLDYSFDVGSTTILFFEGEFSSIGEKNLNFTIDYGDMLEENNEDNNQKTITLEVVSADGLDIAIDSFKIGNDDEDIIRGEDVDIMINIKNIGNVSLTESTGINTQNIFHNFDGFTETNIIYENYPTINNPLNLDEIFTYTHNGKYLTSGNKTISYKIDTGDDLNESNELNNNIEKTFYVYATQEEADQFKILNVTYDTISSSSIRVKWTSDKNANVEVMYNRDIYTTFDIYKITPRIDEWPKTETASTSSIIIVENLTPSEGYIFKTRGYQNDAEEYSEIYNFIMPANDTIQLTSLINKNIDSNASTTKITWSTNMLSSGYVYYKLTTSENYLNSGIGEQSIEHQILISNLEPGNYEYYVESESGEDAYKSELGYFTIDEKNVGMTDNEEEVEGEEEDEDNENDTDNQSSTTDTVSDDTNNKINNKVMYSRLKGKIMLKVEDLGKAYYINADSDTMHYLGKPADAYQVMREQGIGITNNDLAKIPIGFGSLTGPDLDEDGLPDLLEDAIGTDKNKADTDSDGHNDQLEIINGYSPTQIGDAKLSLNTSFAKLQAGRIFLQIETHGEAWYINPTDSKRYFLGRANDAFQVMRNLGLGISNNDFNNMR